MNRINIGDVVIMKGDIGNINAPYLTVVSIRNDTILRCSYSVLGEIRELLVHKQAIFRIYDTKMFDIV